MRLVRLQREVKAVFGMQLSLTDLCQHSTVGNMIGITEAREVKQVSTTVNIDRGK